MTRAAAMIVVMVAGPGGDSLQGPEVLEHGALPLGGSPHGGQQAVAGLLVRGRAGVLRGSHHTDPRALIPFVRQDRHPQPGRPVQGRQHMQPRRGQVVGGAGLHRTGVDRESGENPSPPARCRPAPRPRPEYHRWRPVSGLRRATRSVRIRVPSRQTNGSPLAQPLGDLGKVRGPVRDHAQGLMQIPVGRGPAHLRIAGQGGQGRARHHPPQQEHRLNPAGGRPGPRTRVVRPAVGGQPQADGVGDGLGNIESGRIGHPRGDPLVVIHVVRTHYPGPVPARTTPWSARCFSDRGFWWSQAACFWLLSSCSTSLGVR